MGKGIMWMLTVQYVVIGLVFAWERDWGRALYFAGATVLNVGVILAE